MTSPWWIRTRNVERISRWAHTHTHTKREGERAPSTKNHTTQKPFSTTTTTPPQPNPPFFSLSTHPLSPQKLKPQQFENVITDFIRIPGKPGEFHIVPSPFQLLTDLVKLIKALLPHVERYAVCGDAIVEVRVRESEGGDGRWFCCCVFVCVVCVLEREREGGRECVCVCVLREKKPLLCLSCPESPKHNSHNPQPPPPPPRTSAV